MELYTKSSNALQKLSLNCRDLFEQATLAILSKGKIPRHIGFILDGNRRFAHKAGANSTKFGHYEGFKQLEKVLEMCMKLGVEAVTVYAFSIENFKRSKTEIDYLMELFRKAFETFCDKNALVEEYEIGVRFLGKLDSLPNDVAEVARRSMENTKHNKKRIFNICCPYTSRDEMTTAIKQTVQLVQEDKIKIEDIDQDLIKDHLFTSGCPPLEVLVRTSGEIRLSDFLLWQANDDCQIQFVDCYWPEFTLWKFLPVLLEFQIYHNQASLWWG
ncbi:di-trans,poly-cis-decaprenylcistransferase [Phycomyces nitens]|nr:di-trans,poly-cis-decaprenylcistransferase [Phycomyces nitens]